MTLSSSITEGCGFPEEYFFWLGIVFTFLLVISFMITILSVKEDYFKRAPYWFTLIYIFNAKAFTPIGNFFRILMFILGPIVFMYESFFFKMYDLGWFTCTNIVM